MKGRRDRPGPSTLIISLLCRSSSFYEYCEPQPLSHSQEKQKSGMEEISYLRSSSILDEVLCMSATVASSSMTFPLNCEISASALTSIFSSMTIVDSVIERACTLSASASGSLAAAITARRWSYMPLSCTCQERHRTHWTSKSWIIRYFTVLQKSIQLVFTLFTSTSESISEAVTARTLSLEARSCTFQAHVHVKVRNNH